MSCVADAKAAMMKKIKVHVNNPTEVLFDAIIAADGVGMLIVRAIHSIVINACMPMIHHRLERKISTNGLHRPFKNHGK